MDDKMKPQKEDKREFVVIITVILFLGFVGSLIWMNMDKNEKDNLSDYQQGYINGTQDTQIAINNQILYGLATYGEWRSAVIYQNQSIPILCKVVQR